MPHHALRRCHRALPAASRLWSFPPLTYGNRFNCSSSQAENVTDLSPPPGAVPPSIWQKTTAKLHTKHAHPLNTLSHEIRTYFNKSHPSLFLFRDDLSPIVSPKQCFDDLLVPCDHVSRAPSDTYYIDQNSLLRTHMTAHDVPLLQAGYQAFVTCGDVYRRDTVDSTHYPVFHQIDAVRLYPPKTDRQRIVHDLQALLGGLAHHLFGKHIQLRWNDDFFPFTEPSFELEIQWNGQWLELLGCGLLRRGVLSRASVSDDVDGWAFGLGLERLAMVLFDIPDIRLFWSQDERFLNQFNQASLQDRFKPFSVYPSVQKDISFWVNDRKSYNENDLHEIAREMGGDLVESVTCIDRFEKTNKTSLCYRMVFRSMERNLTHAEINEIFHSLRQRISEKLSVTLR